jgi:hypothetical protein
LGSRYRIALPLALLVACVSFLAAAQEPQEKEEKEEPSYEFFSGTVVESQSGRLTVLRTIAGKPPERKTFKTTPQTTVEGRLRSKARVTVGYITTEEGDVALRVVVRPAPPRR